MGGGEVVKKGYLIKSPPLDGKGMKVCYQIIKQIACNCAFNDGASEYC